MNTRSVASGILLMVKLARVILFTNIIKPLPEVVSRLFTDNAYYLESFQLLERAQEENRRLLSLLEDRDNKIFALEARIYQLQREMSREKDRLSEENAALIRAMASLATAK